MKRGMTIVLLIGFLVLFSCFAGAVPYVLKGSLLLTNCSVQDSSYDEILQFQDADNVTQHFCLLKKEFSTGDSFLIDSALQKGSENSVCDASAFTAGESFSFTAFSTETDRSANARKQMTICQKRNLRNVADGLISNSYFSLSACTAGTTSDSFVDYNGKVVYYCKTSVDISIGTVSVGIGECYDTNGEIDEGGKYGYNLGVQGMTFPAGGDADHLGDLTSTNNYFNVKKDYCADTTKVHEYYCVTSTKLLGEADANCGSGSICKNGRCTSAGTSEADVSVATCFDSDEGENNYTIAGYVEAFDMKGVGTRYYDVCLEDGKMWEYYCSSSSGSVGEMIGKEEVLCEGSDEGACNNRACISGVSSGGEEEEAEGECTAGEVRCALCSENLQSGSAGSWFDNLIGSAEDAWLWVITLRDMEDSENPADCQYERVTSVVQECREEDGELAWYRTDACTGNQFCKEGVCEEIGSDEECERDTLVEDNGENGDDACQAKFGEDAYCSDEDNKVEIIGSQGCSGSKEVSCSSESIIDNMKVDITCCILGELEVVEGYEEPQTSSGTSGSSGSGFGGLLSGLLGSFGSLFGG